MSPTSHPVNLTPAETAQRLGVTVATLANWRCAGVGPAYLKIGARRIMYPVAALEEFEREATVRPILAVRHA